MGWSERSLLGMNRTSSVDADLLAPSPVAAPTGPGTAPGPGAGGREWAPAVLAKLGIAPGTETRSAKAQLVGVIAPRLLLPTKWFEKDARRLGFDLPDLKDVYPTAGYE